MLQTFSSCIFVVHYLNKLYDLFMQLKLYINILCKFGSRVMRFALCVLLLFFFLFFFSFLHAFQGTSGTVEYCSVLFGPFFLTFLSISGSVHCSRTHKFHFLSIFSLNMGPTVLFTHLKIILLQCFKFSVFSFSKISSI